MNESVSKEQLKSSMEGAKKARYKIVKGALVGYLILFGGFVVERQIASGESQAGRAAIVESGDLVAVESCNRDFRTTKVLRGVLETARTLEIAEEAKGESTQAQLKVALEFYDSQLAALKLPDCREAAEILVSDPDKRIPPLKPLFEE